MTEPAAKTRHSPIVELRQYDLNPGTRDTLIDIFEAHLVEGQEAEGMTVIGQFRDLDNPDSFVWLRGFADMQTRRQALDGFYSGPVWKQHRDAANATMIRFDNVHLLRPAWPAGGFALDVADRPAADAPARDAGIVVVNIVGIREGADDFPAWHRQNMLPPIAEAGADVVAAFVTEPAENTYPALPVHTDRIVLVIVSRFADVSAAERTRARLAASPRWAEATRAAAEYTRGPPQTLRLSPTARSLLR